MLKLENCIITNHTSLEWQGDTWNYDAVNFSLSGDVWQSGLATVPFYDRQIAGFHWPVAYGGYPNMNTFGLLVYANEEEDSNAFQYIQSYELNQLIGGSSKVRLTISPNNSPENLEGKDYQYVISAAGLRVGPDFLGNQYQRTWQVDCNIGIDNNSENNFIQFPLDTRYTSRAGAMTFGYYGLSDTQYTQSQLPDGIKFISYYDTGVPNTPGNTVEIAVYLELDWVMPANNISYDIPFQMDAVPYRNETSNLTWIVTNQIWPNYNPWKWMTGYNVRDSWSHQWFEQIYDPIEHITWPQETFTYQYENGMTGISTVPPTLDEFFNDVFDPNPFFVQDGLMAADQNFTSELASAEAMDDNIVMLEELWLEFWGEAVSIENPYYHENFVSWNSAYEGGGLDGGWTVEGYKNWLEHEFIGKQNPRIFPNCTITQLNGGVQDENDPYTWKANMAFGDGIENVSSILEYNQGVIVDSNSSPDYTYYGDSSWREIKFKITPDPGYTVSHWDFSPMTKDVSYDPTSASGSAIQKKVVCDGLINGTKRADSVNVGGNKYQRFGCIDAVTYSVYNTDEWDANAHGTFNDPVLKYTDVEHEDGTSGQYVTTHNWNCWRYNSSAQNMQNSGLNVPGSDGDAWRDNVQRQFQPRYNIHWETSSLPNWDETPVTGSNGQPVTRSNWWSVENVIEGGGRFSIDLVGSYYENINVDTVGYQMPGNSNYLFDDNAFFIELFGEKEVIRQRMVTKCYGWEFGYPMIFTPHKNVFLDGPLYCSSDMNMLYSFETGGMQYVPGMAYTWLEEGDSTEDYAAWRLGNELPGGCYSFASYVGHPSDTGVLDTYVQDFVNPDLDTAAINSWTSLGRDGVQKIKIYNTVPHTMMGEVPQDNEVIVSIVIREGWTFDGTWHEQLDMPNSTSTPGNKQAFLLQLWGQAREI